jgi:hypothetical protein
LQVVMPPLERQVTIGALMSELLQVVMPSIVRQLTLGRIGGSGRIGWPAKPGPNPDNAPPAAAQPASATLRSKAPAVHAVLIAPLA